MSWDGARRDGRLTTCSACFVHASSAITLSIPAALIVRLGPNRTSCCFDGGYRFALCATAS